MKRDPLSWILLAAAGFAAWWWWKNRGDGGGGAVTGDSIAQEAPGAAPIADQIGSNYVEDSTPELVNTILGFAERQTSGCWIMDAEANGRKHFTNKRAGEAGWYMPGFEPRPICGLMAQP